MNQILNGRPMTIFGDGQQTRAFSYVDDVAPHIARSVHNPAACNEVINIGADQPYTINELARVVAAAFGVEARIQQLPARDEVVDAYASHEKAANLLGAGPCVTLEEGVDRMARWARRAGCRQAKPFQNIEVLINLPPSWSVLNEVPDSWKAEKSA
jgi:UDP-glucose 4-epimerase